MKRILTVVFVIIAFTMSANAQKLSYGVKGGLNFATLRGENTDDFKMRTSFNIGFFTELGITDSFTIQPELLYSSQGAKFEKEILGKTIEDKLKLDYLTIPVMGKFHVGQGITLEFGPQIGFLMSAKNDDGDDIKDTYKGIDFGLNFGVGYELNDLYFQVRYNLGLSDIYDDDTNKGKASNLVLGEKKNGVIQLSVGYYLF